MAVVASAQLLAEFLRSKSGRNFMLFATLCAVMALGIGVGSYLINLHWFQVDKGAEKVTALELVDSFVAEYSKVRGALKADDAPVPATFRAHAIEQFNKKRHDDDSLRLLMVGPAGREIATAPSDAEMAATIERFIRETNPKPETRFTSVNGNLVFRTIYPSIATQQSCVDCHNMHQAGKAQWHLNDVMGALAIEVPAAGFLRHNLMLSVAIGLVVFLVSTPTGAFIFAVQFRELRLRERTEQTLRLAAAEIELLNRDLERRVDERSSELRAVQDELLRKERLSTLGQLTATVAHELRNPLSSIRNTVFAINAAVAQKGLNLERPLARMERGIARCDRIITDLLDYTRIREMKRAPVTIEPWLAEVLEEQKLPEGVALVRRFGAPGTRVSGDIERLRRVVINLVENAVQAMPEAAGHARQVTVATRLADGRFEMAVEDTGAGIAPDVLPKVFEPLFSTKSFGTGLGLATVKQIIEEHGGTIRVDSRPGSGTTVTVELPAAP